MPQTTSTTPYYLRRQLPDGSYEHVLSWWGGALNVLRISHDIQLAGHYTKAEAEAIAQDIRARRGEVFDVIPSEQ